MPITTQKKMTSSLCFQSLRRARATWQSILPSLRKVITSKQSIIFIFFLFFSIISNPISASNIDNEPDHKFIIPLKIHSYLKKHSSDREFTESMEVDEDTNYSVLLSILWLYSKWLETQPDLKSKIIEDYNWFKSEINPLVSWDGKMDLSQKNYNINDIDNQNLFEYAINLITNWDETRELNDKEKETFETFISLTNFFENFWQYLPSCLASLDEILKQTNGRKLKLEYSIASLFTLEELKELMNTKNFIHEKKLIQIRSLDKSAALFKNNKKFYFFDPNSKEKETKSVSANEVAELIFKSYGFDINTPSPLGFQTYSFDEESLATYPSHEKILAKTSPILKNEENYENKHQELLIATKIGCLNSVIFFLEKGTAPNIQDEDDSTPLMYAAFYGDPNIVKMLLQDGALPNISGIYGVTAYMVASIREFDDIKEILLQFNSEKDDNAQIIILSKIASYLQKNSQNKNLIINFGSNNGYCNGISALWLYCKWLQAHEHSQEQSDKFYNWSGILRSIIDSQDQTKCLKPDDNYSKQSALNHNWFNSTRNSILNWNEKKDLDAKTKKNIETFISLLEIFQKSHIYLPAYQNEIDKIFKLTNGGEIIKEYSISSLFTLEQLKKFLKIEGIIQDKKMVSITSHDHATALFKDNEIYHYLDPNNNTGEIQTTSSDKLAELIFDSNEFYDSYPSPLSFSMFSFEEKSSTIYLSPNQVLNQINPSLKAKKDYADGLSGLINASMRGDLESARYFLEKKADPNIQNKNGETALIQTALNKKHLITKEILEKGINVNPNIQNKDGDTALTIAAYNGHYYVVKEILEKGVNVDLNLKDKNGQTALDMAKENGHTKIVKLLEKKT